MFVFTIYLYFYLLGFFGLFCVCFFGGTGGLCLGYLFIYIILFFFFFFFFNFFFFFLVLLNIFYSVDHHNKRPSCMVFMICRQL